MSALSSPYSLLTVHASSTPINAISIIKIGAGLAAFFAPAAYASRSFAFSANKSSTGASAGASVGANTTKAGSTVEATNAIRLTGARDIALGLLLRDSTAAVVTRALQVGVVVDILDILAAGLGIIEGNVSTEVATAVAGIAAASGAFQLWILNRN
ncbi:hypothetical protein MNV49_005872 [Pseudohyphozyma bogoriensis]|nr:hypothetical protein MNV49_005872 [Pseudohyphozyma bogoriensis]